MKKIGEFLKVIGDMVAGMGMGALHSQTAILTKANINLINDMAQECIDGMTGESMMDNFWKTNVTVEVFSPGRMVLFTRATS
mmetsp:Transcript_21953/g.52254  ORF Transcript_21953/g.52254 Transcript_21953/m.52254 type:complete len:82 (-) Transcript_21953:289-534(-)